MKSRIISILILTIINFSLAEYSVFPPGPQPVVYLDFEYHGGSLDTDNPAFHSKAPGIWNGTSGIGSASVGYCSVSENTGIDGYDCLDKTMVASWGQTGAFISIGSDAIGYDNVIQKSLDNLWSFTVCGWFKATSGSPIGGNARLFYRRNQFEIYAPDGDNTGKLAVRVPALSGSNQDDIIVYSDNVYNQADEWLFFAATYDGTANENNVKFYIGDKFSSVSNAGGGSIDAGQLIGGVNSSIRITGGGESFGAYAAGGYFDKFSVYASSRDNDNATSFSLVELENLRRWHLRQPLYFTDALAGDVNLDGRVTQEDLDIIESNIGSTGQKFWYDGDFNGDFIVDNDDLAIAIANYTGDLAASTVDVMVLDSMTKINSPSEFIADNLPELQLSAARGENEHFQIAIMAKDYRIENVGIAVGEFVSGNYSIPAENIKLRRADKVRVGAGYDELYFDPLVNKTTGTATTDDLLLFWVSFDIPLTQRAMIYSGTVEIVPPAGDSIFIPVELNVWDITIGRKQNYQTSFNLFRQTLRNYYGGDWLDPTSEEYRRWLSFCTDYRVSPIDMSLGESSENRFVKITRKLDRTWEFDFTDFNAYIDYCYSNGMRNFNLGDLTWQFWKPFYGYDEITGTYRTFNLLSSQYEAVFAQYITEAAYQYRADGPRPFGDMAFFYAFDELHPGEPEVLQACIDRHDRVKENWAQLRTLTTAEPRRYPSFEDHVDIWCGKIPNYYQYTEPEVERLRGKGNEIWTYVTGYAPPYCNFQINEPGIEHRLIFWQNWVENIDGFLHWGLNVWPHYRRPNPWVGEMAIEADYDKWPNRAWDDGGWVIREFWDGGGYLIYPSPEGPVASIRLEMMRDGLEDWELINGLNELLERAQEEGVRQSVIDIAQNAIVLDSVVTKFNEYSHDPQVLTSKRDDIADATVLLINELGTQKTADFNGDGEVDTMDLIEMMSQWLDTGIDINVDLNYDEIVDLDDFAIFAEAYSELQYQPVFDSLGASIYLPFENSNGSYGEGSINNPAWINVAINELPNFIGNSQPAYPTITAEGIKGDALYGTEALMSGLNTVTTNWTGNTTNAFSYVQSYTVAGWVNTRDVSRNGSNSYIVRGVGGGMSIKWRSDGRFQVQDTVDATWRYSAWGQGVSAGDWVFFAVTRDDNSIRFYFGSEQEAVAIGYAETGLTLANTADCTRFILGGFTYNGSDTYLDCDIDEIRVFSSTEDNSAALSLQEIEDIRRFDLGL